jgi:hypothetical protein
MAPECNTINTVFHVYQSNFLTENSSEAIGPQAAYSHKTFQ